MARRMGKQTVAFDKPPVIGAYASIVGKKEGEGPLRQSFDAIHDDTTLGERSWEKAESKLQSEALSTALNKAQISASTLNYIFAGDLLNQCIGSSFALRDFEVPFFGIYGACSNMGEGLTLASMMVEGGFADHAAVSTSSHFCTAERQYRMPLEYGGQRTPTAQWTVTGAGAAVMTAGGSGVRVTHATTGKIVDPGITDAANMGAAMAPAAYDTITAFFADTGTSPGDYDLVVTGDLGFLGGELLMELFRRDGVSFGERYSDCGMLIFDREGQDVHAGASGCGCSASVLCGHILGGIEKGTWKKVLFAPTGALLSPASTQQGESIPGICHLVCLSAE